MRRLQKKTLSGFALLNVMLGTLLLTGIIYLIMHAMSNYHSEENARTIGEELSPIIAELLVLDLAEMNGNYPLIGDSHFCKSNGLLSDIPLGYLRSLKSGGFDLCNVNVNITSVTI